MERSKKYNHPGLLVRYITAKAASYKELRGRTRKGRSGGFSWEKYNAALLSITSFSLKDIAQWVNVSYGLLRKWRTEPHFRKLIEEHRKEFVHIVVDHIRKRCEDRSEKTEELIENILRSPLGEVEAIDSVPRRYDEFKDSVMYGGELILDITEAWSEICKEFLQISEKNEAVEKWGMVYELSVVIRKLLLSKDQKDKEKLDELSELYNRAMQALELRFVLSSLLAKDFCEEDKKLTVYILSKMNKEIAKQVEEKIKKFKRTK